MTVGNIQVVKFGDGWYGVRDSYQSYDHGGYVETHHRFLNVHYADPSVLWNGPENPLSRTEFKNKAEDALRRYLYREQRKTDMGTPVC